MFLPPSTPLHALQCYRLWDRLRGENRWTPEWAMMAMAAADNTALCLEHYCDRIARWACRLATACQDRLAACCHSWCCSLTC